MTVLTCESHTTASDVHRVRRKSVVSLSWHVHRVGHSLWVNVSLAFFATGHSVAVFSFGLDLG